MQKLFYRTFSVLFFIKLYFKPQYFSSFILWHICHIVKCNKILTFLNSVGFFELNTIENKKTDTKSAENELSALTLAYLYLLFNILYEKILHRHPHTIPVRIYTNHGACKTFTPPDTLITEVVDVWKGAEKGKLCFFFSPI